MKQIYLRTIIILVIVFTSTLIFVTIKQQPKGQSSSETLSTAQPSQESKEQIQPTEEIPTQEQQSPQKQTEKETQPPKPPKTTPKKKNTTTKKKQSTTTPSKAQTTNWWDYPKNIKTVTRSGDDLLVLVNKEYKLPPSYAPKDLVLASTSSIRTTKTIYIRQVLIDDLKDLGEAAKKEGIDLSIISGYRSYTTQQNTYNYWVKYNGGDTDIADQISARPGHSQHQLGTAVDFSTKEIGDKIGSTFNNTEAAKWLEQNAWKYGFVIAYPRGYEKITKYAYESWHYRYIGKSNAQQWHNSGLILELWLQKQNGL